LLWRIREGCGRFPRWQSSIKGSLKNSRRQSEVLNMNIYLHQNLPPLQQKWTPTPPEHFRTVDSHQPSETLPSTSPHEYPSVLMQGFYFPAVGIDFEYSDKQHQVPMINSHDLFGQVSPHSLMAADTSLPFHDDSDVTSLDPRKLHSWIANADSGQL
jgi:hypothetical protein